MADVKPCVEEAIGQTSNTAVSEIQSTEFSYVERNHFTSEAFKIEIGNIPKYSTASYGEYRRLLKNKLKLNPHKIKLIPNIEKIYVTFKNEADKQAAMLKLANYKYKGRTFYVKSAKPKVDAMAVKRPHDDANQTNTEEKRQKTSLEIEDKPKLSAAEMVRNSATKWFDIPYEEQLSRKYNEMRQFLQNCRTRAGKLDLDHEVFVWIMKHRAEFDGMCCPLLPIMRSPVTEKYRNKSEYTAGLSMDGLKTIGYRVGKYRDKTCAVEETSSIEILPDKMQKVAKEFQDYIRSSPKATYDPQSYKGHWRQLTVRTTLKGEVMAIIIVMESEERDQNDEEIESLKNYFQEEKRANLVSTLLYQVVPSHRGSSQKIEPPKIILGSGQITETLLDLEFRISPDAFFQCNTLAAEVLYSQLGKMIHPDYLDREKQEHENTKCVDLLQSDLANVVLFDVCCGTGTIGLTLASRVQHVVGIELNSQAVEDAKQNAEINGIKNVEFHCGKAEDIMPGLINKFSYDTTTEIIAVVDPPRAGLQDKVIQCMRKCSLINTILYVACNPPSIYKNFTDLCRRASKRMPGLPFLPYCAQPVDLFPHTPHCELIIYFKRTTDKNLQQSDLACETPEEDQTSNSASEKPAAKPEEDQATNSASDKSSPNK